MSNIDRSRDALRARHSGREHALSWRPLLLAATLLLVLPLQACSNASGARNPPVAAQPPRDTPVRDSLLISERQMQAAMLAHNNSTSNRAALLFCVDYVRLGSYIPIERCDTAATLAREGLLRFRQVPKLLREQARRAGVDNPQTP